jgi:Leucine-rich repeat (LRR) protein
MEEVTRLKHFYASDNLIATYPGSFYKLSTLFGIIFFTVVNAELFLSEHLQTIDFSNNPLTALPVEVGNLQLLKELQKWEVGIGLLANLITVSINEIQLTAWPAQFETLVLLQTLSLSRNYLSEIPISVCDHIRLTGLDASHNQITKVPLSLFYLPLKVS